MKVLWGKENTITVFDPMRSTFPEQLDEATHYVRNLQYTNNIYIYMYTNNNNNIYIYIYIYIYYIYIYIYIYDSKSM